MRTIPTERTEQSRVQVFPPCVICGRRHNWRECDAKQRRERKAKQADPQRGGDPAKLADVLLANRDLPAGLRERLKKRKAREERKDG